MIKRQNNAVIWSKKQSFRHNLNFTSNQKTYFGPSGAVHMVSDSRRPLFLVINHLGVLGVLGGTVAQNPIRVY